MGTIKQNRANFITTAGKLDATGLNNDVPASNITNASMTNVTNFPPSLGTGIKQVSSDPPSPTTGQVWFNTTTNVLKQYVLGVGSWASGGNLNTSRSNAGGAGIQTSAMMVGKDGSPQAIVEEYNGSSWTEVGDLTTGRNAKAMGANTEAVLAVGGYDPGTSTGSLKTESWNGSSWTEVNDLNVKREAMGTFGIYTAGIIASGFERGGSPARPVNVESWDGTNWTEVNNVNTGRSTSIGSGLQPSGILSGGAPAPATNLVESWDGTSWTEVADMNQNRGRYGGGSGTSNTAAMVFGGYADPPSTVVANTEIWDGSSWTETTDLSTARNDIQASSNAPTSLSLAFGGLTPSETAATEEWTQALATQTITTS